MRTVPHVIRHLLYQPTKVALFSLLLLVVNLGLGGNLSHLWSMHQNYLSLAHKIADGHHQNAQLNDKLQAAQDPVFIEKEAKSGLNLSNENELVFVFY